MGMKADYSIFLKLNKHCLTIYEPDTVIDSSGSIQGIVNFENF